MPCFGTFDRIEREIKTTRHWIPSRNQLVIPGVDLMSCFTFCWSAPLPPPPGFPITWLVLVSLDMSTRIKRNIDPNQAGYFSGTCLTCIREVRSSDLPLTCLKCLFGPGKPELFTFKATAARFLSLHISSRSSVICVCN